MKNLKKIHIVFLVIFIIFLSIIIQKAINKNNQQQEVSKEIKTEQRQRDEVRRIHIGRLFRVINFFYQQNNVYPLANNWKKQLSPYFQSPTALEEVVPPIDIFTGIPIDPYSKKDYQYSNPDGTNRTYQICALLEETKTPLCFNKNYMDDARATARDAKRIADVNVFSDWIETFYQRQVPSRYPNKDNWTQELIDILQIDQDYFINFKNIEDYQYSNPDGTTRTYQICILLEKARRGSLQYCKP